MKSIVARRLIVCALFALGATACAESVMEPKDGGLTPAFARNPTNTYPGSPTDNKSCMQDGGERKSATKNEKNSCIRPSTIVVTGSTSFPYTGSPQGPDQSTTTGSTGSVTYSYSGTGSTTYGPSATKPTAIGAYQVVATLAADANYDAATSAPYAFSITTGVSSVTVTGATTYTYTGNAQGPSTSTKSGSTGTVTYSYTGTGSTTYGPSATKPTAVGTYEVVATLPADANYAGATSAAYAFSITTGASTVVVTGKAAYGYTGSPLGPDQSTTTGSTGAVTYSYSGTGSTSYGPSATKPTEKGTYQVVATLAADANYNGASSAAFAFEIGDPLPEIIVPTCASAAPVVITGSAEYITVLQGVSGSVGTESFTNQTVIFRAVQAVNSSTSLSATESELTGLTVSLSVTNTYVKDQVLDGSWLLASQNFAAGLFNLRWKRSDYVGDLVQMGLSGSVGVSVPAWANGGIFNNTWCLNFNAFFAEPFGRVITNQFNGVNPRVTTSGKVVTITTDSPRPGAMIVRQYVQP